MNSLLKFNSILVVSLIVFTLCLLGCRLKLEKDLMPYDSFGDMCFYKYSTGIILAYKPYDSFHAVSGYKIFRQVNDGGVGYNVVLSGKSGVTDKQREKIDQTMYFLPDGLLGHFIEIGGFDEAKDKVYYLDEESKRQYLLKFRGQISAKALEAEKEKVSREIENTTVDLSK